MGPEPAIDPDPVDLPDASAARAYAVTVARELTFKCDKYLGHRWPAWSILVSDEQGAEILSFPLEPFSAH